MKNLFFMFLIVFMALITGQSFSQFTAGNIVVVRIGNGGVTLSDASFPVFLDEYTTSGNFVQSLSLPTTNNGSSFAFVNSGYDPFEGSLTLSFNGKYLCFAGYNAPTGVPSIATAAGYDRVIARVDKNRTINTSTKIPQTEGYLINHIRGAVTFNGTGFWTSGTGTGGGTRYITLGSTSGSVQISSTITDTRVINIFNGQLYISSAIATGAFQGISAVGTGLPTTTGQTTTLLNGFPTAPGPSSNGFSVNPAGNIIYVADDRPTIQGGGIQKWTLNAGTWSLAYTIIINPVIGCRGLTVDWSGANPVIYITGADNQIYKVTDVGSGSIPSVIATGSSLTVIRGIAFAPWNPITSTENNSSIPNDFHLAQNYPNPFNPETNIQYSLPEAGFVSLKVFNTLGIEVQSLVNGSQSSGVHEVKMNGANLSSGIYYYKLNFVSVSGKNYLDTKKLMLIK